MAAMAASTAVPPFRAIMSLKGVYYLRYKNYKQCYIVYSNSLSISDLSKSPSREDMRGITIDNITRLAIFHFFSYYDQTSGSIWWKKKFHGNSLTIFCSSHVAVFILDISTPLVPVDSIGENNQVILEFTFWNYSILKNAYSCFLSFDNNVYHTT